MAEKNDCYCFIEIKVISIFLSNFFPNIDRGIDNEEFNIHLGYFNYESIFYESSKDW